ncbi:MAG: nucleotidyltransferase family protein, partial [Chloroflexota bacterium]
MMIVSGSAKKEYQLALRALMAGQVAFVIGGAWAVEHYVPLGRPTLDLDLMVEPSSVDRGVQALCQHGGRLLGRDAMQARISLGGTEIDLVHHFAQGEYAIDGSWRQDGLPGYLFDVATLFAAPADLIWSKAFVASRHRFDGSDIVHLIRSAHRTIDWQRLRERLSPYPELLLAYLNLFEFCYPGERDAIPDSLWDGLFAILRAPEEPSGPPI